ncbi:MAG: Cof-type HAD-IIB family hydrolase [Candidatus Limnocylindrales bacterium]
MTEIRLLALDLDGTILAEGRQVSVRTHAAVARAMERGVRVVLATGRMYRSALPHVEALDLDGPLICYQGAYIRERPARDGSPGELLRDLTLPGAVARDAVRWSREHGLDPHVNRDDRLLMEVGDEEAPDYERHAGISAVFVPDLLAALDGPVTKVLAVRASGVPEAVLGAGRVAFDGRAEVTVSHPDYLEFTAPGVHKGAALAWLAAHLGIQMSATMAIGDQFNDLEMLAMAGLGVAMGGSPPAVQAAADYVTASIAEDGAAQAIERFVLGRPATGRVARAG